MVYSEATWPKAVNLRTAVERVQRQCDAIGWDALLNVNRMGVSAEERKQIQEIEEKHFLAVEKCEQFLKNAIDFVTLKKYFIDSELDEYVTDLENFAMLQ